MSSPENDTVEYNDKLSIAEMRQNKARLSPDPAVHMETDWVCLNHFLKKSVFMALMDFEEVMRPTKRGGGQLPPPFTDASVEHASSTTREINEALILRIKIVYVKLPRR